MKTSSILAILACLAYQASSLPVATTSAVEKREETAETPEPLYYFYGKREEAEAAETPEPLYYFYGKREEAPAPLL
jgi:hypothetical protein